MNYDNSFIDDGDEEPFHPENVLTDEEIDGENLDFVVQFANDGGNLFKKLGAGSILPLALRGELVQDYMLSGATFEDEVMDKFVALAIALFKNMARNGIHPPAINAVVRGYMRETLVFSLDENSHGDDTSFH